MKNSAPIGIFDSGLGGITVLSALQSVLPNEKFIYFADTRYLPYGDRSEDFILHRAHTIAKGLIDRGAKALVVACNTATAIAADSLRESFSLPIVALEPGIKPAIAQTKTGVVGVMATTRTLQSKRYQYLQTRLTDDNPTPICIINQPCKGLAEAIEREGEAGETVNDLLSEYLPPIAKADVVVLGCTHYAWIGKTILRHLKEYRAPNTEPPLLIDTGYAVAKHLSARLAVGDLLYDINGNKRTVAPHIYTNGDLVNMQNAINRLCPSLPSVKVWEI